jgi:FtsZ family, C-terminal domain
VPTNDIGWRWGHRTPSRWLRVQMIDAMYDLHCGLCAGCWGASPASAGLAEESITIAARPPVKLPAVPGPCRVSEVVTGLADPSANVIFGAVIDDAYDGEVHVTIIATGFTPSFEDNILAGKVCTLQTGAPLRLSLHML